ncbi:MAG TPA: hypothetical protein VI197_01395 [Polyangiaceae bacterium]
MSGGPQGGFGQRLSLHQGTFAAGGWLWYIGAILLLSGVLTLAQLAGVASPSQGAAASGSALGALGMAAACFIAGALLLIVPVLRWRQQVELFEGGFVWRRLTGQLAVPKHEVHSTELITHHSRSGTHVEVIVHLTSGRELSMSGLSQADQLANLITAYARPAPQAALPVAPGGWRPPSVGGLHE